ALPPFALGVEVAENAALTDPARTIARLGMLRGLGMKVAYDNFGAGYSSLQHLVQLPVDAIKLDRAHVASLTAEDPRAGRAVIVAVVAAARELGIRVVAEGVDDPRTLALVAELGCDAAQGRAFGDPQPARSVEFAGHAAAVRGALAGR
ncbi:MAG TPA: EAL domain-containing protein, partial [Solirubrobacteraceae bacterium]|nr:EAL domain-containing protein [Solirubrobacteraceae bacterium]